MDLLVEPTLLSRGDDWVIVDKPSGIFVHRSAFDATQRDVLLTRVRDLLGQRVHAVHRLDRPTSGPVLFALNPEAAHRCQLALRQATKVYLALVRGRAERLPGRIDRPLRPPEKAEPVPAVSHFDVLTRFEEPRCALVECRIETGRFHQIRRHLAGAGHPVLLDSSHGDSRVAPLWRSRGLNRLFLHCSRLALPLDGGVDVRSPLPLELQAVLDDLEVREPG